MPEIGQEIWVEGKTAHFVNNIKWGKKLAKKHEYKYCCSTFLQSITLTPPYNKDLPKLKNNNRILGILLDPSLLQNNGLSCRAPLLIKRPSKLNHLKAFSLFSTTLLAFSFHPSSKPCTVYLKKLGKSAKIMH